MQRLITGILTLLALAAPAPALAQGFEQMPEISRRNVESYARILDLTDEQREVVMVLHEGYLQAVEQSRQRMRELEERMQRRFEEDPQSFNPEAMQEVIEEAMRTAQEQFTRSIELQEAFLSDVRATLSEEQERAWPRVERKRKRDFLMAELVDLSWASADLVDVLESIGIEEPTGELREAVIRYEQDIDRPLGRVYDLMLETIEKLPELMAEMDQQKMMDIQEEAYEGMGQMRAVNKRHARLIGTLLSADDRARFDEEARRRAFPTGFRESTNSTSFQTAEGLADLTAEQAEAVQLLHAQYKREVDAANTAWCAAIDDRDEDFDVSERMLNFGQSDTEVDRARESREDLDATFRDRLEAVLTPEQVERLPEFHRRQRFVPESPGGG